MEHTLVTEPDAAQLAVRAAGFVADRIRSAVAAHGAFTCAVSGGQTPARGWIMGLTLCVSPVMTASS